MTKKIKLKISARLSKKRPRRAASTVAKRCRFKAGLESPHNIDYKNVNFLKKFITERGKILPARISGNSNRYQRKLSREIRKARTMALLPYCITYE